jgi:pilus assembly protein CpaC
MNKIQKCKRTLILCALAIAVVLSPVAKAVADKADLPVAGVPMDSVDLMTGTADIVTLPGAVSDVMVANPMIVDVMAVKANQLYLVGGKVGETNIMALDEEGNVLRRINVHVRVDTKKVEDTIRELYPNEGVKVGALRNQLVLTGNVSTPAVANSIARLVAQYASEVRGGAAVTNVDDFVSNMMTVSGEQQVMLKVKIIEASRSALKDLGLTTTTQNSSIGAVGLTAGALATGLGLTSPVQLGLLALNYDSGSFGPLSFAARALEEEGILNTLAEPNLTSISGEQAGFLAGGEVPVPTELDRNGNLVYEFRPFGVSLNFRPTVMSSNRISLEMSTEVSSATYEENLQLEGVNVPTFNVRRAQTTVELPSGGTLMIAGLLQSDVTSSLNQIPGVGKVPVLGDLLKSDSFQRNESELVVLITPYLVKPFGQPEAVNASAEGVKGDLSSIPRLSMEDLGDLPEENDGTEPSKVAMAPPSGLSAKPINGDAKLSQKKEPLQKKPLAQAFENNVKRSYNSKKAESVMKDMGSFGYLMD